MSGATSRTRKVGATDGSSSATRCEPTPICATDRLSGRGEAAVDLGSALDPAGHARDQEGRAQRVPEEVGPRVDRNQVEFWQRSMHQPITLKTRRDAERADRLVDDDAQVVLLPLHVVYWLFLGHWSSIPYCRAGATSPRSAHAPSSSLSALPSAHDALRRGGVGTEWTTGGPKRIRRWRDLVAFHLSSDVHATSGRLVGSGGGRGQRGGTWAATARRRWPNRPSQRA